MKIIFDNDTCWQWDIVRLRSAGSHLASFVPDEVNIILSKANRGLQPVEWFPDIQTNWKWGYSGRTLQNKRVNIWGAGRVNSSNDHAQVGNRITNFEVRYHPQRYLPVSSSKSFDKGLGSTTVMVRDDYCHNNWQGLNKTKLCNYWELYFPEWRSDRTFAETIWIDKVAVDDGLVTWCTNVIEKIISRIEHCGFVGKIMEEWASWLGCVARKANGEGQSLRWWKMTIQKGVHCPVKVQSLACIMRHFQIQESARRRHSMHQRGHLPVLNWNVW